MIGYAPFEPDDPVEVVPAPRKREVVSNDFVNGGNNRKIHHQRVMRDDTECNYLVMFFIVGVIALAAMDAVKR
tara:strand:+ start:107 stop:325 length:219 start_codon:yes stop_codon:yes gene_type:complete